MKLETFGIEDVADYEDEIWPFFFRVFFENRHLEKLHFTFFLISKVNRVIFIEEV